jgi:hypothetical protein
VRCGVTDRIVLTYDGGLRAREAREWTSDELRSDVEYLDLSVASSEVH